MQLPGLPLSRTSTRLVSNYLRMGGSFVLSVVVVRLLLEFGSDVYATVALLGAGTGISAMIEECVQASLTPSLALAYHRGDRRQFLQTYSAAAVVCLAGSLLSLAAFLVLFCGLSALQIPDHLLTACRWFVVAKAAQTCIVVLLAPSFSMYLVTERIIAYNVWLFVERLIDFIIALALLLGVHDVGPATAVMVFGLATSTLRIGSVVLAAWVISVGEPACRLRFENLSWAATRQLLAAIWGNSAVVLAMALYVRLDMILLNLAYGLSANLVFSLAAQLTAYLRMLTTGITTGLDVIAARALVAKSDDRSTFRDLVSQSTRLHGLIVLPSAWLLFLLADPLVRMWVGSRLDAHPLALPQVVLLVRILVMGVAARSLSEGWMRILAGRGEVNRYSFLLVLGAAFNPLLVAPLLWFLPEQQGLIAAGLVLSLLQLVVHQWGIPFAMANSVGIARRDLWRPLLRPLLVTLAPLPLLASAVLGDRHDVRTLAAAVGLYLLAYALLAGVLFTGFHRRFHFFRARSGEFPPGASS